MPPIRLQCLDPMFPSYSGLTAFNLGHFMGLRGLVSLVPLVLAVCGLGALLRYCLAALVAARAAAAPHDPPSEAGPEATPDATE